jgi:glycine/D-amino acid oxidase-like deaminating enzyme/RimJ/RimL family protein N-acetyltransferase
MDQPATTPIWAPPPRRPPAPLPRSADVIVVGGGITGASVAHHLAARGVSAVLLERHHLAAGASGRNAGFVLMGVAANYALAVRRHGRGVAREVWHFTAENHARLAELLDGRAGHVRRGSLTLAATPEESELLGESEALLREDGLPGRLVAGDAPALCNDADGELDPAAAVAVIAGAAPGATLLEGVEVLGVEPGADGVRVHCAQGECLAAMVVLATNGYTSALAPSLPIAPVRAQMLATAPFAPRVAERPTYAHWGYRYWRQRGDGRVLLGGWRDTAVEEEVGTDAVPTWRVQSQLDAQLAAMQVTAPVTHRWAGIMGFSPDELPLVGPVAGMRNVHVCGGYTGHGMGFALHAAQRLVGHMLDGDALPAWLRADRAAAGGDLTIRPATLADAAALGTMHVRGWQWAYRDILPGAGFASMPDDVMQGRWRTMLGEPPEGQRVWIAEVGGDPAGFCLVGPCRDADAGPGWMEVNAIYLGAESFAGRGIGRALLGRALDDVRSRGARVATLWVLRDNARARRFYAAAGFTPDGAEKVDTDREGVRYEEVRYRLDLQPQPRP